MTIWQFRSQEHDYEGQSVPAQDSASLQSRSMGFKGGYHSGIAPSTVAALFAILLVANFVVCMMGQRHDRGRDNQITIMTIGKDLFFSVGVAFLMADVQTDFLEKFTNKGDCEALRRQMVNNITEADVFLSASERYTNYTTESQGCFPNHYEYNNVTMNVLAVLVPLALAFAVWVYFAVRSKRYGFAVEQYPGAGCVQRFHQFVSISTSADYELCFEIASAVLSVISIGLYIWGTYLTGVFRYEKVYIDKMSKYFSKSPFAMEGMPNVPPATSNFMKFFNFTAANAKYPWLKEYDFDPIDAFEIKLPHEQVRERQRGREAERQRQRQRQRQRIANVSLAKFSKTFTLKHSH